MKRSMQEIVELVVFGMIAVLLATGVLWLVGWLFGLVGAALIWLTGLVWAVLQFIVPVAVVAGIVYLVVRLVQQNQDGRAESARPAPGPTPYAERTAAEPTPARSGAPEGVAPPPPNPGYAGVDETSHDASVGVGDQPADHEATEPPPPTGEDEHPR
jgi:uncharacterized membrane protein